MAFVIKKNQTLAVFCTISEPNSVGGFSTYKVPLIFKLISQGRIDAIIRNDNDDDINIMDEILVGWEVGAFSNEDGTDIPFNEENKTLVLDVPYIRNSMVQAFFTSIAGKKAKAKN
jgi:hypothetical protein